MIYITLFILLVIVALVKFALAKSKPKYPIALTKHKESKLECPLI